MNKRFLSAGLLIMLIYTGCLQPDKQEPKSVAQLEDELYGDTTLVFDQSKFGKLIDAYIAYADQHTGDTLSAEYLFRAGQLAMSLEQPERSISMFNRVIIEYPTYLKAPDAYFLMGFVYENSLKNIEKAGEIYTRFIEKFPDHDFADDAAIMIMHLGKTPDELIREFEGRQQETPGS